MCFKMPKSCIACENYCVKGYAFDKHSPFKDWRGNPKHNGRVQYGFCSWHECEVFATEICNDFDPPPDTELVEVVNRPEPKEIIQARLL